MRLAEAGWRHEPAPARSCRDRQWPHRRPGQHQGRLVWWCFPRFDSDPVFCRLIAGDEEKGFSDVVLDRQVNSQSAL